MIFIFLTLIIIIFNITVFLLKKKECKLHWIENQDRYRHLIDEVEQRNLLIDKLKKVCLPFTIFCFSILALFCFETIRPGEVGVVVNMLGDVKGVEQQEKTVGIHFIPPWKNIYKFPIFEQNHQWTDNDKFTFQTSEGLQVSADIGISYHLEPTRIHDLFCRYRRGMEEITHLFIRNNLRDYINKYASTMKVEDIIGPKKEEFFNNVQKGVQSELNDIGFIITHVYIIGQFDVPKNVIEALNNKIEATQRAQQRENELREAEAQARKIVAETEGQARSLVIKAEADAKANDIVSKSLTKELLEWQSIHKWDGKLPYAMGGQNMPFFINIPKN